MSLQFVLGGSGSGKSTYIYDRIIRQSMSSSTESDRNYLIIVPDQFTMETQRELVNRHPRGGIMNIDVLSFGRLAYRILGETGGAQIPVLDDTGKSLVLRKVAESLKEEVPLLGRNLKKIGYIHEVKSAISEFMQYGIGQKEMENMMQFSEKRGSLYAKLSDLNTLYQGFLHYIDDKFITTEETLDLLSTQLSKSRLVRGSVIVLDGFTGFTPVQNRVISTLLTLAEEVIVSVTVGEKGAENSQLFSLSKKTMDSLTALAHEAGEKILEPVWMERGRRFGESEALAHLENSLFRYPVVSYPKETDSIELAEAMDMAKEVRGVCGRIRGLLEEGWCYRDMAVICADLGAYSTLVEEIFSEYRIPFFLDQTRGITLNPFIEYIRAALQVVVKQYSYESVFHYLRSGMLQVDRDTVDRLENYVLAYGIRGKKAWNALFVKPITEGDSEKAEEELEQLNKLREQIVQQLSVFTPGTHKVRELADRLYEFLTENRCQQKLKSYETYFADRGDKTREMEYAQIYRLVMELLDQIVSLLGEETMSWEEFGQILDAGFGEIQVGAIPQAVDKIVVGDMERTRLKQVKALFFLGINEGRIPKQTSKGGILSDIDREFLADSGTELAPTPRQQIFIQRFYLYLNVTKPSHRLYLSYAKLNTEGKSMKPSYFVESIQRLFPALEVKRERQAPGEEMLTGEEIHTPQEGKAACAVWLSKYREGKLTEKEEHLLFSLLQVCRSDQTGRQWVEDILDGVFASYHDDKISKEAARLLYGAVIHSSVSRLEKMASCAYAHFLQYGLGLKERQEYAFESTDMGNVFHGVLEIFASKLAEKNYTWMNFPKEEGKQILHDALENYAVSYGNTILFSSARNAYGREKIERILWRTVRTLQYQLQKGRFLPENYELSFSALEDLDSVSIRLNEKERMQLQGRIDRLDTCQDENHVYVKVIDYKSGNQQFNLAAVYYGLQLQLVVYLNAAMELQQKKYKDKTIVPGAFVYYHIEDPMIEGEEGMSEEEAQEQIIRQLRVAGIVNSEPEVLDKLDTTHETKSQVIPVEYKKDGTLSSRSSVMTPEEIDLLRDFAGEKAADLGRSIMAGDIRKNPCTFKDRDSCTFCQFKAVCEFEQRLPGCEKRQLEEPQRDRLWEMIRQTVEKHSEDDGD